MEFSDAEAAFILILKIPLRIRFFKILSLKLGHFDGIEADFG
ncbi:hypothetical protein C943_03153 [Mariniradius saccharolyticus AK6]|uniref:Uncharacterized protein n=1 Tax=Mariniradius saccharolyticus AK6 TaxID=1239962 RepID=M7Y265_9BACT|nr:hypothetical protein C943_03153 [Mariniradius saccharolyticus AK6]